jgi:DNA-binding response OmpR family regulator
MSAIIEAKGTSMPGCRSIEIDRARRAVQIEARDGKHTEVLNLTPKEFGILSLLVAHERRVTTRETMLEKLWGDGANDVYSECIDKHVESLRKKMGRYGKKIKTVYGSGYIFTGNDEK